MGLTVHYDWKIKTGPAEARRLIARFHAIAKRLPFDDISEIYEQDPPDGAAVFRQSKDRRWGDLYLPRTRADGDEETVCVPALHAVFFVVRVEGAESAPIGLASHPPVVVHREDVIRRKKNCTELHHGQGAPVEFPTRRRGYYSWQSFCKTQYAAHPKLGGEANFLKAHLSLIELLDRIQESGARVRISDDSRYAKHRDVNRLLRSLRDHDALIARFVGKLDDALGNVAGVVGAPIKERPDFEHLEAKGIRVLKRLVAKQRRRKKDQ